MLSILNMLTIIITILFVVSVGATIIIGILKIGKYNKVSKIISIILAILTIFVYINLYKAQERSYNDQKHKSNKIHKQAKQILNIKTKHKNSSVYLYGVYSDNSLSKDKDIISCYNKFHNIKATTECLKGKL